MRTTLITLTLMAGAALGLSACAYSGGYGSGYAYDDGSYYGDYRYDGRDYDTGYAGGEDMLDPWLGLTPEGRDIVALGFSSDGQGLSEDKAYRANIWFRRYADSNDDLRLTDEEIRLALVQGSRDRPWMRDSY